MNPLYLINPADACPVCGTKLRDRPIDPLRGCPWGPHDQNDYPSNGDAA